MRMGQTPSLGPAPAPGRVRCQRPTCPGRSFSSEVTGRGVPGGKPQRRPYLLNVAQHNLTLFLPCVRKQDYPWSHEFEVVVRFLLAPTKISRGPLG